MPILSLSGETDAYRAQREALNKAELALRDQREHVAALRRALPSDTVVADEALVEWRDGARHEVQLSELFENPSLPLIALHFMYGESGSVCPMCAMWADGYNALIQHLKQRCNFVVLIAGDPERFADVAKARGWTQLRIVSAGESSIKRDLGVEDADGGQSPGVSVYSKTANGTLIHHYSQSAIVTPVEYRGMDLLSPVWHFFDLLPEGRGDWMPGNT